MAKPDPGPVKWEPLADQQTLEQQGIYDRRFVFYRTHLDGGPAAAEAAQPMLNIAGPGRDSLLTFVNGTLDPALDHPGAHKTTKVGPGDNAIEFIYENVGQPNGGTGMEKMSGITKIDKLVFEGAITDWRMNKIKRPAGRFRPGTIERGGRGFRRRRLDQGQDRER